MTVKIDLPYVSAEELIDQSLFTVKEKKKMFVPKMSQEFGRCVCGSTVVPSMYINAQENNDRFDC